MKFEDGSVESNTCGPVQNQDLDALRLIASNASARPVKNCAPRLLRAIGSYDHAWETEFSREHDHFGLLGQDNIRRYLPFREIRVRVCPGDTLFDILARVCAARATGARVILSAAAGELISELQSAEQLTEAWGASIEFIEETDNELAALVRTMPAHTTERIRFAAPDRVSLILREAAAESGAYLADEPVVTEGRVELLWYLREQSVSYDYHRYGNLGARSSERRRLSE
jgi:RHH-type proline utilization regulon transcriptional repressor/proline dehydrogenase/delta 1-pyrroline-5-carboxylate dehydrogenase